MREEPRSLGPNGKAWDAFIMIVDIVRFSEIPQHQQVEMVRYLIEGLKDAPVFTVADGLPRLLNSTGDGFLLAIPTTGSLDLPIRFCESAATFVKRSRSFKPAPFEVRVGIHRGDVVSGLESDGVEFAVGVGLNWCARVASLAEPSQILVSERFFKHALQQVGPTPLRGRVHPPAEDEPFQLVVKHGRFARVRDWRLGRRRPGMPRQLARDHQLSQHIGTALKIIGESVVSAMEALDPALSSQDLRLRLSLWVPREDWMERLPFEHRVLSGQDPDPPSRRNTRYRIGDGDPSASQGPVPRAYRLNQCQRLLGLPDPATESRSYFERLAEDGISLDVARDFSRKSRSMMCVPLPLLERPSGVLCLDAMLPLDSHAEAIDALLDDIKTTSGYFLAALIELRLR